MPRSACTRATTWNISTGGAVTAYLLLSQLLATNGADGLTFLTDSFRHGLADNGNSLHIYEQNITFSLHLVTFAVRQAAP
jgi:hypothetical protein